MDYVIRAMEIGDYDHVHRLWKASEGVGLSSADTERSIAVFLERNPGLSHVAHHQGQLIGAILCGHDGRRGYIHHLAVSMACRKEGVGRALVAHCLDRLEQIGIQKCHIFVFAANTEAKVFWDRMGWIMRGELTVMSMSIPGGRAQP
jgi:ribosomal protein S18 acetylase RimI-like enzyme